MTTVRYYKFSHVLSFYNFMRTLKREWQKFRYARNVIAYTIKVLLCSNRTRRKNDFQDDVHSILTIGRNRARSLNGYWIYFFDFIPCRVRRRQRWAYSEITFVPGGCISLGLLLALQHRSSSSPFRRDRLIRFYFPVDRLFLQIYGFFPGDPSFSSQVP